MDMDIESVLYTFEDSVFVDFVVAGINYADGFRPALLSCADSRPEDSFAATSCIAIGILY